jgi:hypothetical protein
LETLLDLSVPVGKPGSRAPHVLAAMAQARRPPAGGAADEARRPWVTQTHQLAVN